MLVVGGGLVGLSAALFLSHHGVRTVLVERHAHSSPHPRAIGYTPRTMEILAAVGLGDRIPQIARGYRLRRVRVESLAGKWFDEEPWTPANSDAPKIEHSPHAGAALAQDRLEPILRERAIALGADVRMSTELVRLEPDADGVTAWLRHRDGHEYTLRAAYVVAADGHRSPIRQLLGVGQSGRGHLRTVRSVLYRAPLDEYLASGVSQFAVEQPDFQAFLTTYQDGRWVLIFGDDQERDEATLKALVQRAIGRADVPIELITTGRWEVSALIAERFSVGKVFLAGDAAHTLPPSRGGFGANTGIEDAHNLAWKIAAVSSGSAGAALLDSYDTERRPIAWLRHDQIFARSDYRAYASDAPATAIVDDDAMEFGQLYRSSAVVGAGTELPPAARPEAWAGQPGTRARHAALTINGQRRSTLDLYQQGWLLVTNDEEWQAAAATVQLKCTPPIDPAICKEMFGLTKNGATLVRPDGYIAWRAVERPTDPSALLTEVLQKLLAR